jgi:hypothetical protein
MNIILDRFPLSTEEKVRNYFNKKGFKTVISVLTIQSINPPQSNEGTEFFMDRTIARGSFIEQIPWILTSDDINTFSKYESLILSLISRYDLNQKNFSQGELSEHYLNLLNFWSYKINQSDIGAIFSHYLPHDPSSFVLYVLSKERKIPYIFIDCPVIANSYKFMSCSFGERLLLLRSDDNKPDNFNYNIEDYISSLVENSDNAIPIPVRINATKETRRSLNENLYKIREIFLNGGFNDLLQKFINNFPFISIILFTRKTINTSAKTFFKVNRKKYSSEFSDFNVASYKIFLKVIKIKLFFKRQSYKRKALQIIPDSKFIYFAAPAQPEATTLPSALEQRRVFVALRMLKEALPDDVRILFKENPVIFTLKNPYISGADNSKHNYYESILEIGKIDFIDSNINTLEIIESSIGVAAINGTAPIEAVIKNKPAITLSTNWYDDIDGVFKCKSVNDMKEAIEAMLMPKKITTNISSIPFNKDILIEINKEKHTPYEYDENIQDKIPFMFDSALELFNNLDERKWKI